MPGPTLTFGFLVATLYGAGFHLVFGGNIWRLALFTGASWLGFTVGHIAGIFFEIDLFNIGALHFLTATVGALVLLLIMHILTRDRRKDERLTRSR